MQLGKPTLVINAQARHKFVSRLQDEFNGDLALAKGNSPETGLSKATTDIEVSISAIPEVKSIVDAPMPVSTKAEAFNKKKSWTCCWPFGKSNKVAQAPRHHKGPTVLDYDPNATIPGQVPLNRSW